MSFASTHNHSTDWPSYSVQYASCKDLPDLSRVYPVKWVGSYRSRYGQQPYFDTEDEHGIVYRVRLPKYTLKDVDDIANDPVAMSEIKSGKVGVAFTKYRTQSGNETFRVIWKDI